MPLASDPVYAPREVVTKSHRGRCAVASRALAPGTACLGFSGLPYGACPLPSQRDRVCAHCFGTEAENGEKTSRKEAQLLRCGKCRWVRYCSRACQKADWALHKTQCGALASAVHESSPLFGLGDAALADALLVGRCIWRRRAAAADPGPDDLAFDDLELGEPSQSDHDLAACAASAGLLPADAPATAIAADYIAAFGKNNFGVLNAMHTVVGAGCYPAAALLNHSCDPSCVLAYDGARLEVRVVRPLKEGDELTHSYVELCAPTLRRRKQLKAGYGFDCVCRRCEAPCVVGRSPNDMTIDMAMDAPSDAAAALIDGIPEGATAVIKSLSGPDGACKVAEGLVKATQLLRASAREDDIAEELKLVTEAVELRRLHCHPCSTLRYEAEGTALSLALAVGDMGMARQCCRALVFFLENALAHIPHHPLLALQRFTLSDLELAGNEPRAALEQMALVDEAMKISYPHGSAMRQEAAARLAAMKEEAEPEAPPRQKGGEGQLV